MQRSGQPRFARSKLGRQRRGRGQRKSSGAGRSRPPAARASGPAWSLVPAAVAGSRARRRCPPERTGGLRRTSAPCSGRSTVDSRPYRCCGGTVPRIAMPGKSRIRKRSISAIAVATSPPQDLGCGTGSPVEPEVNTMAAMRSSPVSPVPWASAPRGRAPRRRRRAIKIRVVANQPLDRVGRMGGRHQADLAAQQRRGKAGGEAEAIRAEVDYVAAIREALRRGAIPRQEIPRRERSLRRCAKAIRIVANERQIGHRRSFSARQKLDARSFGKPVSQWQSTTAASGGSGSRDTGSRPRTSARRAGS